MSITILSNGSVGSCGVVTLVPRNPERFFEETMSEVSPKEMSLVEKQVLDQLLPEMPPLPFPLISTKMAYGEDAKEYVIPEEFRGGVLAELYPFFGCPALTDVRYDLHQKEFFTVSQYRVIRERGRNIIVSPDYPRTGGMVIDWVAGPGDKDMEDVKIPRFIKKQNGDNAEILTSSPLGEHQQREWMIT